MPLPILLALLVASSNAPALAIASSADLSTPQAAPACASEPSLTLARRGMVDVSELAPKVLVRLKYSVADNFMGEAVYGPDRACWLQREAAEKLAAAQRELTRRRPGWRLLLGDCLRPRAVQRRMWSLVAGTPKQRYVARPDPGSMHNHGAAVDVSIADETGAALDMGTPFDHFGPLAQPLIESRYLVEGRLTREQVENRQLLREVMTAAGWRGIRIEWWHFEAFPVREIRARFPIVEHWPDMAPGAPCVAANWPDRAPDAP
ncbi:MAG: M15 family metallopeptidase [Myxococcales bacterium]|jgi:D-alanyl-D-alanine dipeptidase